MLIFKNLENVRKWNIVKWIHFGNATYNPSKLPKRGQNMQKYPLHVFTINDAKSTES
jgi:hypothetical protein